MKYSEIRSKYQNHNYVIFVDAYACLISPLITKFLIKTSITPNQVTVLMMISGIIGAVLFAIPNILIKILGVVFIHLWYVLDCCDGEVARIKKKYSKFGKEIDYTAHILNHPCFTFAFLFSMLHLNKYDPYILFNIFMFLIIINLVFRNLLIFNSIYAERMNLEEKKGNNSSDTKANIIKKVLDNLAVYPNFVLIFPIIYIIDYFFNMKIAYIYIVFFAICSFTVIFIKLLKWIKKIVNI